MTIVESLKKFLTKLGGDATKLENNATSADIIDAISEAYTDKEGTYTEVTPIVAEGTKIATITTNNTPHDIYAPNPPTELPAVTSADEGDVLGVNSDGEWVKMDAPSGGGVIYVNFEYSGSSAIITDDITPAEIYSRILNGENVVFKNVADGLTTYYYIHYTCNSPFIISALYFEDDGGDVIYYKQIRFDDRSSKNGRSTTYTINL
ncbi:MAG: hypothetical protein IKF29_00575 [Oceanobacillus sp.]|nr:hypothetical protein [Oceanobacillus sp.]